MTLCKRCRLPFTPVFLDGLKRMSNHCKDCMARNLLDNLNMPTPPELLDHHTKHPTLTRREFYDKFNRRNKAT